MDASMKIISQKKRPTFSTVNTPKLTSQQTITFAPQPMRFAVAAPPSTTTTTTSFMLLFTATGTHARSMDVSSVKQNPLTTKEKKSKNKLGLCRYCGHPGHIAIDYKNPNTLLAKRCAAGIYKIKM